MFSVTNAGTKRRGNARAASSSTSRAVATHGGSGLRVDPLGNVHYDGPSDDSDDEEHERNKLAKGDNNVGVDAEALAVHFKPAPYLRPKVVPDGTRARFAPPTLVHSTLVGFHEEDVAILFGGAEDITPRNDTWIYHVEGKVWKAYDPLEPPTPEVEEIREARGLSALESIPPPRCGHCAVAMMDIPQRKALRASDVPAPDTFGKRQRPMATTSAAASPTMPTPLAIGSESDASPSYRPSMFIFGGADLQRGKYHNDLWCFDVQAMRWELIKATGTYPSPRWHCTAAALENRMFIFGGESSTFVLHNDLHMYDHSNCSWRQLRVVAPVPTPRMLHTATAVGDKMIVVGGVGPGAKNNHGEEGARRLDNMNDTTDVWCLEMRTLLWRQLATIAKPNSPFAQKVEREREASSPIERTISNFGRRLSPPEQDLRGSMKESGSARDGNLPVAQIAPDHHTPRRGTLSRNGFQSMRSMSRSPANDAIRANASIRYVPLEGHVALPFDNFIVIHGGRFVGGNFNNMVHCLDIVSERWYTLGEVSPHDNRDSPQVRSGHCACVFKERSQTATLDLASTLEEIDNARFHLSDEGEMKPFFNALTTKLAAQLAFEGVVSFDGARPLLESAVFGLLYGGHGYPRKFSDCWRVDFSDNSNNMTEYECIVEEEASKRREVVGVDAQKTVLGHAVDRQEDEVSPSRDLTEMLVKDPADNTVSLANAYVMARHVKASPVKKKHGKSTGLQRTSSQPFLPQLAPSSRTQSFSKS